MCTGGERGRDNIIRLEPRLSIPDFVLQLLEKKQQHFFPQSCETQNPEQKPGFMISALLTGQNLSVRLMQT